MDRLLLKHKAAAKFVPEPIVARRTDAQFGVLTMGGCDLAVREALDLLAERGVVADFMRVRGFPFDSSVEAFLEEHDFCFVVSKTATRSFVLCLRSRPACRRKNFAPFWFTAGFR